MAMIGLFLSSSALEDTSSAARRAQRSSARRMAKAGESDRGVGAFLSSGEQRSKWNDMNNNSLIGMSLYCYRKGKSCASEPSLPITCEKT